MIAYEKRLVLWDVDYTLVDSGGLSSHSYRLAFQRRFGRDLTDAAPMLGRTDRAIVADTLRRNGVEDSEDEVEAFRVALEAVLVDRAGHVRRHGRELTGAGQVLAALGQRPEVVQSLLTGNIRSYAEAKIAAFGLDAFVDLDCGAYGWEHTVRAELVGVARAAAAKRHGIEFAGRSTVLIGDTPLDVEAALATGAGVVAVASGSHSVDELRDAGAHVVLADLGDTDRTLAAILAV